MVYVGKNEYAYGRMIMSHMSSPDLEELHEMADRLGLKRKWFQNDSKNWHPHYDVSKGFKQRAIEYGAKLVPDKELIRRCYPNMVEKFDIDFYCGNEADYNEKCAIQCEGCNNAS